MMNFGMVINNNEVTLVDATTGEILSETKEGVQVWLDAYENNFTLQLLN